MSIKELEEYLKVEKGIPAQDQAAGTVNGVGIDTRDYDSALVILDIGDATSGDANVKVQDSADNSTFADVTGAVFAEVDSSNDLQSFQGRLKTKSLRRYIRIVSIVATNAIELCVIVILGKNDGVKPVSQANANSFTV